MFPVGIIRMARNYYKPRFDTEQVADINGALNLFGDNKQSHRTAEVFYISSLNRKINLTAGSKSKPDEKSTMWWRGIMTNNKGKAFR